MMVARGVESLVPPQPSLNHSLPASSILSQTQIVISNPHLPTPSPQVDYLGRQEVDAGCAQDHGCTDEAVGQLCREGRLVGEDTYILYSTCSSYSTKSVISTITDQNHKW